MSSFIRPRCWACLGLLVLLHSLQPLDVRAGDVSDRASNGHRVGGVPQVQLNVLVAEMRHGLTRCLLPHFLKGSGRQGSESPRQTNLLFGTLESPDASRDFVTLLQGLRDENLARLLAEPRLVTLSGRQASFLSGGQLAVPIPEGVGQVGVQFEEFGTRVNFLPVVGGNGKIHLELEAEVSQLEAASSANINGATVPGRTTQRVHTSVDVKDGQTFVLGGLVSRKQTAKVEAVPVLSQLPVVGPLFATRSHGEEETDLVLVVTPSVVDPTGCEQADEVVPAPRRFPACEELRGQGNKQSPGNDSERIQRLERRLIRLEREMDDLRRELRSLPPTERGDQDERYWR
jgi:pilus assembly protein CpaC